LPGERKEIFPFTAEKRYLEGCKPKFIRERKEKRTRSDAEVTITTGNIGGDKQ